MAIETLGAALKQINRLFSGGAVTGFSDAQLLERFVASHDAAAFEALVAQHGPMVLSVCRGILNDPNDAEDAFQATFLILVKKSGTFRGEVALAGWLYLVAHRVAIRANAAAARRRAHERQAGQMAAATRASVPEVPVELLRALHEEIARLPDKFRPAIVLCDLQGVSHDRAAGELRVSERTLRRRLSEGRRRLKARLGRRGLAQAGETFGAILLRESRTAIPACWGESTARAALATMNHAAAAGVVSVAATELSREVLKVVMLKNIKLISLALAGAGLIYWTAAAALIPLEDEPPKTVPAAAARTTVLPLASQPDTVPDPLDAVGTFPVHGRVLDPDGKPVAGATIYVHHDIDLELHRANMVPPLQSGRVASSDADGRFRFDFDKSASDASSSVGPAWHHAQIAVVAPGFGPAWVDAEALAQGKEAIMRLVRDDIPIRGRILDLAGRPVSAATIRIRRVGAGRPGSDLDAILAGGVVDYDMIGRNWCYDPTWLGRQGTWTTGADGRFEITGVGRDRIVGLDIDHPATEHVTLYALTRTSPAHTKPHRWSLQQSQVTLRFPAPSLVSATFEHFAGPTKPITGVVRLKDTGKPLAGAQVYGYGQATRIRVEATTDVQGRFRLLGLPKSESYPVHVAARSGLDPFLGAQVTLTDTVGLQPIETAIDVPAGVIVTGRLIDTTTGRSVQTNELKYQSLPGNPNTGETSTGRSGTTDPKFRITVRPGRGVIVTNARGWENPYVRARLRPADKETWPGGEEFFNTYFSPYQSYRIIDIPPGVEAFTADLELTRGLTKKGTLVDPDGKPVIGARCYGVTTTWGYIKTLTDDRFEVLGLETGRPRLMIFAHKDRGLVGSVLIKDEDLKTDTSLVVRLKPAGSIKGRLVDEDGVPMAGIRLGVMTYDQGGRNLPPGANHGGYYCLWPDGEIFVTDANGRFQIDGLKPGVKASIQIEARVRRGFRLDPGKDFLNPVVQPGEVRDLGDVKVKESAQ
jgi:RNA polymerase sigma factor (sigma-70 family)